MAQFEPAARKVMALEGGYVNDPNDRGGETKFGISKRRYPNEDIRNLTEARALELYRRDFWPPVYGQITYQAIADKVYDLAVNAGPKRAHELLQRAAVNLGKACAVDGAFGPGTLAAVNAIDPAALLAQLQVEAIRFYAKLAGQPGQAGFLRGWVNRALS